MGAANQAVVEGLRGRWALVVVGSQWEAVTDLKLRAAGEAFERPWWDPRLEEAFEQRGLEPGEESEQRGPRPEAFELRGLKPGEASGQRDPKLVAAGLVAESLGQTQEQVLLEAAGKGQHLARLEVGPAGAVEAYQAYLATAKACLAVVTMIVVRADRAFLASLQAFDSAWPKIVKAAGQASAAAVQGTYQAQAASFQVVVAVEEPKEPPTGSWQQEIELQQDLTHFYWQPPTNLEFWLTSCPIRISYP